MATGRILTTADRAFFSILPQVLVASFLVPILIPIGPMLLMPHRIVLIFTFFPLMWKLLSNQAGPKLRIDLALLFSAFWATIAIFISKGTGAAAGANPVEAAGIYWVEFIGAYLVGRVCIRSATGFIRLIRFLAIIVLILLPFALFEAVSHRPILLDLIPNSIAPALTEPRLGLRRVQASFAHPILFGIFVSSAFGLFWYALHPALFRRPGVFTALITTILSLSTGALISVVMQFCFILWEFATVRIYWRWRLFAGLSVVAYVATDLFSNRSPVHVLVTYASFNSHSAYARIQIWEWGTENVATHPWFGLGLDVVNWARPIWKTASVDNFWLLTAMTYGLPSVIAFIGAVLLIISRVSRATFTDPIVRRCQAGFLTSAGGIIIAGGTVHYWHAMLAFVMFFFGTGVWMTNGNTGQKSADEAVTTSDPTSLGSRYTRFPAVQRPLPDGVTRPLPANLPHRRSTDKSPRDLLHNNPLRGLDQRPRN